ncbi:MAG: DNA polymerase III subunit [Candidatus Sericytochromatia bacterium]|nr:DNA polymerase III subunit [Candidatus Sericytochromatia bacterium]
MLPKVFAQLPFVNSPAVQLLARATSRQQLAHAYLLKGEVPQGLQLACALAQSLFCAQQGCGICRVCQQVASHQHPDWHQIQAAEDSRSQVIKLEQIQRLVHDVGLPPHQASHQVFVIAGAENMPKASSNALLKTLEEPASNSIILLLTPHLARILPTLRSRSQILYLPPPVSSPAPDDTLWHWEQLEAIQSPAQLPALRSHLDNLSAEALILQLQVFQRECWHKIRDFIVSKHSLAGLQRAKAYLQLFEDSLQHLHSNAHKDMLRESFAQRYLHLRQGTGAPRSRSHAQKGFS